MKRASSLTIIVGVFILMALNLPALADKKPEVTSHTAKYVNRAISIDIQWQAENPVVLIRVAAGSEVKEINLEERDNRRVSGMFTGEVNVILNAMPAFNQDAMSYTVQIQDDLKLKSHIVTGRVSIPTGMPAPPDDQWAQDKMPGTAGSDILGKTAAVRSRHTGTPQATTDTTAATAVTGVTTTLPAATLPTATQPAATPFATTQPAVQPTVPAGATTPQQTGFVMVVITPQQAADFGAMWRIDGGQWQKSGTLLPGINAGMHIIDFSDVAPWMKPFNQTINVDVGQTAQITGIYTQAVNPPQIVDPNAPVQQPAGQVQQTPPQQ